MNYPLISEYIESIKSAEDNFDELSYLRPVLDVDGQPVMSSGNFAIVFKMRDNRDGKLYAVKCFMKEQEGRAESYKRIADELEFVSSNYLTPIKYIENELFVDTTNSDEEVFPVLLMDWVEGKTLDKYLRDNSKDKFLLELLAYQFCKMASWLLSQPFAHGDLKPDNILIKNDGSIVLVDYDGMYVPAMKGENAREQGSPGFRHLTRLNGIFDEHIDDFPIALIAMALKAYSINSELLNEFCNNDSMFFVEKDFAHIHSTKPMKAILELVDNEEFCFLFGAFMVVLAKGNLGLVYPQLFTLKNPKTNENYGEYIYNQARNFCEEGIDKSKIDHKKAFRLFQKAARLGNAEAQCCVGCCFRSGYGTSVDYTEARVWYDESSKNGCARAFRHKAMCYEEGLGVDKDIHESIKWYKKAIDHEDVTSMKIMGEIFYYGREGIPVDYVQAFKWYKKAAEEGNSEGMRRLGVCYHLGKGVEKNEVEAFKWFQKAAEEGDSKGMWRLGICYHLGKGVEKNEVEAFKWFQKAAEAGNSEGMWRLNECYLLGKGVEQNGVEAFKWLKKAAEAGHPEGMCRLGEHYQKNEVEAFKWFQKAAEAGNSKGMWRLGVCYHLGKGVEKNEVEAFKWFQKAAEAGDSNGMWRLGVCYHLGTGVEKNEVEAFKWLKKAAEEGNSEGQWYLGCCYENGIGTTINLTLAESFFRHAAIQGHKKAQEKLKQMINDALPF